MRAKFRIARDLVGALSLRSGLLSRRITGHTQISSIYGILGAVKTTLDISKETLRQVKTVAAREGVPMREVFERGMRAYIAGTSPSKPFRLRTVVTKGQGLAKPRNWAEVRELIYEGQGGDRE